MDTTKQELFVEVVKMEDDKKLDIQSQELNAIQLTESSSLNNLDDNLMVPIALRKSRRSVVQRQLAMQESMKNEANKTPVKTPVKQPATPRSSKKARKNKDDDDYLPLICFKKL